MQQRERMWGNLGLLVSVLILLLPVLLFRFLPMTDHPQHLAVVSILKHLGDPSFDFSSYYTLEGWRTLYWGPYALTYLFSFVFSLEFSARLVVFLSLLSYPLGVWAFLVVRGADPRWVWLTFPLVYSRPFFWGFVNFLLAVGLVFGLWAWLSRRLVGKWDPVLAVLLGLSVALTHVYGLAFLVGGLVFAWWLGERDLARRGALWLSPVWLLGGLWLLFQSGASGYGAWGMGSLGSRLRHLPDALLGGYRDPSEWLLFVGWVAVIIALVWKVGSEQAEEARNASKPTAGRLEETKRSSKKHAPKAEDASVGEPFEKEQAEATARRRWVRILVGYALLNLLLYFVLPTHTKTAKFLNFRHLFLACSLLPLLGSCVVQQRLGRGWLGVLCLVGGMSIGSAWYHLWGFDREARPFEKVMAAMPPRAKLLYVAVDRGGSWMRTAPYLHFGAYIQAEKGGVLAVTFPRFFWNIPIKMRSDLTLPPTPRDLEWDWSRFDDVRFGHAYPFLLLRKESSSYPWHRMFPYRLWFRVGPWQLYQRSSSPKD